MLLAFAVGQVVQDFFVGVGPTDPVTYAVISILLATVAMAACFVPPAAPSMWILCWR